MNAKFKFNGEQWDFEKDAAAVTYGDGTLKTALDKLTNVSDFGKKLLAADEAEFKRLLNISTETFWDECQNRFISNNGATTSTAQGKWGTKSLRCTSKKSVFSQDYIEFGGNPFTIAFWVRLDSSVAENAWIFRAIGTKRSFGIQKVTASSNIAFAYGTTSATTQENCGGYTAATWLHIEIGYSGGTLYYFLDGSFRGWTSLTVAREARRLYFGPAACYIDEFRLVDGRCFHTSKFTPPTSAYPKTADNKVLLHFND